MDGWVEGVVLKVSDVVRLWRETGQWEVLRTGKKVGKYVLVVLEAGGCIASRDWVNEPGLGADDRSTTSTARVNALLGTVGRYGGSHHGGHMIQSSIKKCGLYCRHWLQ